MKMMFKNIRPILCCLWGCWALTATAGEGLKVICASRAAKPPVIDGVLDDECWQSTEARDDFTSSSTGAMLNRHTVMRFVYDNENLYMGLEFQWDDIEILKKGIADIIAKHGPPPAGICPAKDYVNCYGVEFFVDAGATQINYYQILFNAAGQYAGNFKAIWNLFKGGQTVKSAIRGNTWTAELMYPFKGLKAGDEWGINLCRNDESYYGIWKQVGGDYHAPKMFGRVVLGNYREWWDAVWTAGAKNRLNAMQAGIQKFSARYPQLAILYREVCDQARRIQEIAAQSPPENRGNFESLYQAFGEFRKTYSLLEKTYETVELMRAK